MADPLRAAALEQLERMRRDCETKVGGLYVHEAVTHCMNNSIMPPAWLCALFVPSVVRVREAEFGTLDEAFGRPWPPRTRLAQIRLDRRRRAAVHAALWAEVRNGASLNDELCERIGEGPGIGASASTVWRRYEEAVAAGAMDIVAWRESQDCQLPSKS